MTTVADDRSRTEAPAAGPVTLPDAGAVTAAGVACETLDDGVLAIHGCGSLFLFDLDRRRFQRLPRGADPRWAASYGSWLPLAELVLEPDGTFTVQPAAGGGPRVRSHTHGDGCPCVRRAAG